MSNPDPLYGAAAKEMRRALLRQPDQPPDPPAANDNGGGVAWPIVRAVCVMLALVAFGMWIAS